MTNLIITPVYKAYPIVKEMCEAIDKNTVNSFVHILIDDDSGCEEPFPVTSSPTRRILFLRRDYPGNEHHNGSGQAIQLGLDWAKQMYLNEKLNPQYDNIFMIESDVIVRPDWDREMLEVKKTLPEDWLTLDIQSVDEVGYLTQPTTNTPVLGMVGENLEITAYPDFQVTLFNNRIFDTNLKIGDYQLRFDVVFGQVSRELLGGNHYRTKQIKALHYVSASRKYVKETPV